MTLVHDFVEEWIEMRSRLQRQLKLIEAGGADAAAGVGAAREDTARRLKKWIEELNALLKQYTQADRT